MRFPALWIAREGSFEVVDAPLKTCSTVAYRKGFFDGLLFYDSDGVEWVINTVHLRHPIRLMDRLFNRRLHVDVEVAAHAKRPPYEVAQLLCACIDRDPNNICAQFVTPEKFKTTIRSAQSAAELIKLARVMVSPPVASDPS